MELSFYGEGCVYVATKELTILIDPPSTESGLKAPKVKADVTLHSTLSPKLAFGKGEFQIAAPGEYEIRGVSIRGVAAQLHVDKGDEPNQGIIYTLQYADIRLLVTGNIDPELSDEQVEAIGEVNVIVVPVGGKGLTLDANAAAKIVSQFEPQYIIPVHYDDGATKYPVPQDSLTVFLQEVGVQEPEKVAKLKVSAKNLEEEAKVIVLERQ